MARELRESSSGGPYENMFNEFSSFGGLTTYEGEGIVKYGAGCSKT